MWNICQLAFFVTAATACRNKENPANSGIFKNLTGPALENAIIGRISNQTLYSQKVQLMNLGIGELKGKIFESFPGLLIIDMRDNEISEVEDEIFSKNAGLEKVELQGNRLEKVSKKLFMGNFPDLEEINLSSNIIGFIETGAFDKLPQLESIDLSGNCLRHLHSDLFKKNPSLRTVSVSSNAIHKIDGDLFNPKTELKFLDLSTNNLSYIPELELKRVLHFELSSNKISLLDLNYDSREKKKSAEVVELVLAFNKISKCAMLDERRTDILHLDLSHNLLTDLDDFPSFLNLEVLILASNNVSDLSLHSFEEKFPSLKVLNLKDNPIACSDYFYARNNLQSVIVTADSTITHRCSKSTDSGVSDEYSDYEDKMMKEYRTIGHSIMKQLVHNYSLLIALLVISIVCIIVLSISQILTLRPRLTRGKESLLDQMEL